jgi:hypothetical protein
MKFIKILTKNLVIIILFTISLKAQENSNAWDFPIKPGKPEWKTYITHADKIAALQIPETILKNMSTNHLMEICLTYPFFDEIWAYNNIQDGFEYVIKDFNGLQELLSRKDAGSKLLFRYKNMSAGIVNKDWSLLQQGTYTANIINQ